MENFRLDEQAFKEANQEVMFWRAVKDARVIKYDFPNGTIIAEAVIAGGVRNFELSVKAFLRRLLPECNDTAATVKDVLFALYLLEKGIDVSLLRKCFQPEYFRYLCDEAREKAAKELETRRATAISKNPN